MANADTNNAPVALTVAGSDSGGGAGIQADLKTFAALGVYGCSAITAVTAQNSLGVWGVQHCEPELVRAQIDATASDFLPGAAKTGMLGTVPLIKAAAFALKDNEVPNIVVDPVMIAKSGDALLDPEAVDALKEKILPLARILTPNLHEAAVLVGADTVDWDTDGEQVCRDIHAMGPEWVVLKGGHATGHANDLVFDGETFSVLEGARIETKSDHGTGCTLSAAIAAGLAKGQHPLEAIGHAKTYLAEALRTAPGLGAGHGPVNHMHPCQGERA